MQGWRIYLNLRSCGGEKGVGILGKGGEMVGGLNLFF